MKKNQTLIIALAVIAAAAISFYAGTVYQKQQLRRGFNTQFGKNGPTMMGNGQQNRGMMRPVNGEIVSQNDTSITVKSQDGSSKIIILSDNTSINQASSASKADLKIGGKVMITGNENSDGSLTAQMIQLNPTLTWGNNQIQK